MQRTIKDLTKKTLYSLGYYHLRRGIRAPRGPRLLILMYHDILTESRANDPAELDVESPGPRAFEAHLRQIARHYRVVSLREAVEKLRAGTLEEDSVAITFDDGYESLYTVAYPILKKLGTPATVFLLTDWIDERKPLWWHIVRDMVRRSPLAGIPPARIESVLDVSGERLRGGAMDTRGRRILGRFFEDRLRGMRDEERFDRVQRLQKLLFPDGGYAPAGQEPLNWDQIREMAGQRIEFEAHTHSHINIQHTALDVVEHEVECSKLRIEQQLDREVVGFAYPYGKDVASYAATRGILERHGIRYACTTRQGANSRETDPYLLCRDGLPLTTSRSLLHRALILQMSRPAAKVT